MGDRQAELANGQYELDPTQGGGADRFGTGDMTMSLASQLLAGAKTAEDVAAAMKYAPGYVRSIVLVAQKRFGNEIVQQALYLAQTGDHTAGVKDREELAKQGANVKDDTAPPANGKLPYTDKGWDAVAINTAVGQYDRMAGTDSDGARCAFAVSLAAHIFKGPTATASFAMNFASEIRAEIEGNGKTFTARQTAAESVITGAAGAISGKDGTYGDLAWLQEALHDLILDDEKGVHESKHALSKHDVTNTNQFVNITCMTADDVITKANELQDGEQYMCDWVFPNDKAGPNEEAQGKHEMLIVNQGGTLYLYDSERQGDGKHLRALDAATLARYFSRDGSWITLSTKLFPAPKKASKATDGAPAPKKK